MSFILRLFATGSSELRQKSKEFDSLSDRFIEEYCLPLSVYEIAENTQMPAYEKNDFLRQMQNKIYKFGSYPEVYTNETLSV